MTRLRGRCARGARLDAAVPWGHWKTTTFVAGLRVDGLHAPMVLDGAMDGAAFKAYAEQLLAPCLRPGDIVVMDNLSSHKVHGVRQAIKARSAFLLYLPAYSPDLNPIEQAFAKLKALLRKAAARSKEALWDAIAEAIDQFSRSCPEAWCRSSWSLVGCGYPARRSDRRGSGGGEPVIHSGGHRGSGLGLGLRSHRPDTEENHDDR